MSYYLKFHESTVELKDKSKLRITALEINK